ncbi:hypothetical protein FRACYDRAFT_235625 [Fragilariopsis cylindrus CCMP1102]|uniref:Uncharacterized protein n=1 Tax=Fragilariopsis cylindrus CCMP1102 TaxID=635003 RepID=A0A1E7FN40_9STRA|nr:hypothetical protein FRACYDRAFT_235625 [Fragilariopsis cylindrus CCMP1102]|eukprot:OEU19567.1 hypothetical protein FRACYDRAFT_235625 [Fragilariopsis cylindrus CCMP1102]
MTTPFGSVVKSFQPPQPPKTQITSPPPKLNSGDSSSSTTVHTANNNTNTTTTTTTRQRHNGHNRQRVRPRPGDSNNDSNDNEATSTSSAGSSNGNFHKKGGSNNNTAKITIYTSFIIFIRKLLRSDRKLIQVLIVLTIIFSLTSIIRFSFYEYNNNVNLLNVNNNLVTIPQSVVKTLVIDSSSSIATPPPPPLIICDDKNGYESLFPRNHQNNNHSTSTSNSRPDGPVFLWGIPSTTSDYEVSRRKLLRRTYLNFYRKLDDKDSNKQHHNRICSFHEWTCNHNIRQQCQMIYLFFIGGGNNETGALPIMLNESIIDFRDMLLITPVVVVDPNDTAITTMTNKTNKTISTDSNNYDINEAGTIYLKIYENQFDGKMTTWFKFASLIAKEYLHDIDYIFKVDSDLLLLPPNFFNWFEYEHEKHKRKRKRKQTMIGAAAAAAVAGEVEEEVDSNSSNSDSNSSKYIPPELIYGGIEFPATNCIINYTFDHECPLPLSGRSYMSGELNFVSIDLAIYITSDLCPRDSWTIPHEDVSISNYIYSYQNNTIYHNKHNKQQQQFESDTNVDNNDQDQDQDQDRYVIDIISVNTSRILLLPNMKSDWFPVNIIKNPEILLDYNSNDVNNNRGTGSTDSATTTTIASDTTTSDSTASNRYSNSNSILWGHSIKRGEHKMYLYWKINSKYLGFWNRYSKIYSNRNEIIKKVIDNNKNNSTTRNGGGGGGTNTSIIITTTTTTTGGKNNNVQSNEDAIITNHNISEKLKQLRDKKAAAE